MNPSTIHPSQLAELLAADKTVDLIDVRTPAEFRQVHATIARNIPLDRLDPQAVMAARNGNRDAPLYVICQSGTRATRAGEIFAKAGFPQVICVEGGTQAWQAAGLPVVRGKATISLERQVRITAGLLVLTAAILAMTVHHYFALLAALVGAGLIHSGITDTCQMAMILGRMPWNQVRTRSSGEGPCCSP